MLDPMEKQHQQEARSEWLTGLNQRQALNVQLLLGRRYLYQDEHLSLIHI